MPPAVSVDWADSDRRAAFTSWLARMAARSQLDTATLRLAPMDAGAHRRLRIDGANGSSFIITEALPTRADLGIFVRLARRMRDAGLRGPEVLQWDPEHGFLLLADLGRRTVLDALTRLKARSRPLPGPLAA